MALNIGVRVTSLELLGVMIREDRTRLGLTQEELGVKIAAAIGSSEPPKRSALSMWEGGHALPNQKHLAGLKLVLWKPTRQRVAQKLADAAVLEKAA